AVLAGLHVHRDDRAGEQVLAAALRTVLRRTATPAVAKGPKDHAQIGVERRVHPRGRSTGLPGGSFPGVVAELARPGCTPEMPDDVAVAGIECERGCAVAVVRADVDETVVVGDRDLLHVAEVVDLALPEHRAVGLVERDDPVAVPVGEHLALADGY